VKTDNWMVYIVGFAFLVGASVYWCGQSQSCDDKGGVLVSAPTWSGYQCVQKVKP
jgi:hypothetical protein